MSPVRGRVPGAVVARRARFLHVRPLIADCLARLSAGAWRAQQPASDAHGRSCENSEREGMFPSMVVVRGRFDSMFLVAHSASSVARQRHINANSTFARCVPI